MTESYLLTLLVFSPLLGIILLCFMSPKHHSIKWIGTLSTLLPLLLTIIVFSLFERGIEGVQLQQSHTWFELMTSISPNEPYIISFELGVTGLSVLFLFLTALITFLASFTAHRMKDGLKGFFIIFLALELGILGVFSSENLFLFFLFFEITLVSTFLLLGRWGGFHKERAAFSFLIYNGIGSVLLLVVIITLFVELRTTNITELTLMLKDTDSLEYLSYDARMWLLVLLVVAFGTKLPIVPLHSWMVRVHVEAPIAVVMIHAGVLLKIGAYGLIRFGGGFFPEQLQDMAVVLAILGLINLLYGAFIAFVQTELRALLAYSSISHMGIVLLGLASFNSAGVQGAIFQTISHGLIAALLFLLIGVIVDRFGTTRLDELGGVASQTPLFAGFFLAAGLASLGLPGMSGFISEFLAFLGVFKAMPVIGAIGVIGIILTAVYILRAVLAVTFGERRPSFDRKADLTATELVSSSVLLIMIIWIGVYPAILTSTLGTIGIGG
ncbi:complex I subunit 4 family protein [Guptibacillus algicola]|uniref:complex I subunit 4 family protein n=1 Tax=Guptibacillus algicola TaxID=225844 RepID=UPI001CD30220|nr:NADH-quinone oxidoreductase subunit M [Alkalihalobacillus algicola]MCA0989014.1 NADH-quinone oxidoreductase subunit M [Alkalihalobacillus algicola]